MKFQVNSQTTKIHKGVNTCEYIVLHHTGGRTSIFENEVKYLSYNKGEVSCHYVVGQAGEIAKISDDKKITRHAGRSKREGKTDLNRYSIGIEIVSSDGKIYTSMQRKAVRELVLSLMKEHNIGKRKVIRHKDISGYRGKRDVSDTFWDKDFATFQDYQDSLETKGFYEELFEKVFGNIATDDRILKHPEAVADKLKGLSEDAKNREIGFLIAFTMEKLKNEIATLPKF